MIKGIILDLDNTLLDTSGLVKRARMEACEALFDAGLPATSKEEVFQRLVRIVEKHGPNYPKHFSKLCKEYKIRPRPQVVAAGIVAYHNVKMSQLHLFPKAEEILMEFAKSDTKLALISTGTPIKQWEKIIRLKIRQYFDMIEIIDDSKTTNKIPEFKKFMTLYKLNPDEILVVGDRPEHEIHFGKKLGMKTVRILQGRHKHKKPGKKEFQADSEIKDLDELRNIVEHDASHT